MAHRILIPTPLRPYTDNQESIEADGRTVGDLLHEITTRHPGLRRHLYADDGKLRSFVNVYVNDDDMRYLQREATVLQGSEVISIIPSVAGGAPASATATAGQASAEASARQAATVSELTTDDYGRYSRHLILPEVGVDGQRRLKNARVLCVGAGGLGSPASLYLAAAGVGTLGLVDFDAVDVSNLQRQILHGTNDVGRSKLASARARLLDLNPHLKVEPFETALTSANALEIFRDFDVILDGTDNFATRYLVNDACVLLGKPNAYGSIFRFEGQASVFATKGGPCYRCLYPEPPPPGLVPSCAEGGVLGVLPGVIGTIQATETIKLILGAPGTLAGRLLLYDAWNMKFRELKLRRDPACPVCGDHRTIHELIDYEEFCGVNVAPPPPPSGSATVEELKARLDQGVRPFILDVRDPNEYQICRIPGSVLIPLAQLPQRLAELPPKDTELFVHCKMGGRSAKAVKQLQDLGYAGARNVEGGILAWIEKVDPTQPKY